MKTTKRVITISMSAAVAGFLMIPTASACGSPVTTEGAYTIQALRFDPQNPLESVPAKDMLRDQSMASSTGTPAIAGMWNIQFLSKGNTTHNPPIPDGAVIEFGYVQWHSDGTEFMNSGTRAPATQNFCLGVWEKTGYSTYQLNHFALAYDATGTYTGRVNIIESITLSPGGTQYSGTVTINAYDTKGNQVDHVTGQVNATRVTVDSVP